MSQNLAALIRGALAEVGAVRAGQVVQQTDTDTVTPRVGPLLADLAARRITATVLDTTALPDALFPILVKRLGQEIGAAYGKPTDPDAILAVETRLRALTRLDRSAGASPLAREVLDRLEALGGSADAIDLAAVVEAIPRALADLAARRIIAAADLTAATPEALPHIATVIVARLQPKALLPALVSDAESSLALITRMDRSQDPFILMVLEQLAIYGNGTVALDGAAITGRLPGIFAELVRRGVVETIFETTDIEDEQRPDLARYVAASLCAPPLYDVMAVAERRLRQLRPDPDSYGPACVSFW